MERGNPQVINSLSTCAQTCGSYMQLAFKMFLVISFVSCFTWNAGTWEEIGHGGMGVLVQSIPPATNNF